MGKGSTRVDTPDPFEIAQADAMFNRIDQFTPLSNLQFFGPERNQSLQTLNPAAQHAQNQQLMSDMMLNNMALGRQADMKGGSLPSLTSGINPSAQQTFFGTPSSLQQGFDPANTQVNVPDFVGQFQNQLGNPLSNQQGPIQNPSANQAGITSTGSQGPGAGDLAGGIASSMGMRAPNRTSPTQMPAGQGFMPNAQPVMPGANNQMANLPGGPGGAQPTGPQAQPAKGGMPPVAGAGTRNIVDAASGMAAGQAPQQSAKGGGGQPQQGGSIAQFQQGKAGQQAQAPADPNDLGFRGKLGSLINKESFGLDPEGINRGRAEQGAFNRQMSLMNPGFDMDQERLQQDLANRGIPRDSEAYDRELARFQRNKGETVGRVAQDAIGAGGAEVSRQQQAVGQLFGLGDQISQRDIQAQLQNANIAQSNRGVQFNELAALLGLNQVAQPGLQNFFAPANADVTGAFQINQAAQQNNANNAQAQKSGMMDAATGLIPSDPRVKRDIEYIGDHNGFRFYEFEYIWADKGDKSIGVMADEVPQELVTRHEFGFDMVDYSRIL